MTNYPEHEKLEKVKEETQAIGQFLEWLNSKKKIILGSYFKDADNLNTDLQEMRMIYVQHEKLIAEFYGIDLDKLEQEKRDILKSIRQPA